MRISPIAGLLALGVIVPALAAGAAVLSQAAETKPGAAKPRARIGAYYFDGWAGKSDQAGKAEWARSAPTHLTKRMLDEFPDREPVWGWRDDAPEIMERQIDLAADAGLAFFAFCWYWHEQEKDIREDPKHTGLELFLKAKNNPRLKFCLLVANHAGFEIRGAEAWKKAAGLWMPYLKHPRHLAVAGRPLVIIFNAGGGDKAGFDHLQAAAREAGLPGVAIAACGNGPREMGYTHRTHYNVVPGWEKGLEERRFREITDAHKQAWKGSREQPYIPCLVAGWDRRPWEAAGGLSMKTACWYYPDRSPDQFAAHVRDAIDWMDKHPDETPAERLAVIYAWNEFGEGGYIAPTKGDPEGKYLKALRAAVGP